METKRIVECLRRCEKITGRADCVGCDYLYLGGLDCYHVLKKDAIEHIAELESKKENLIDHNADLNNRLNKAESHIEKMGKQKEAMLKELCDKEALVREAEGRFYELEKELDTLKNATKKQPEPEWISVEDERKPKHLQNYFIAYVFGNGKEHFFREAIYITDKGNGIVDGPHFNDEGVDGMRVTHWMEIPKVPEPPKPKEPTFKDVFLKAFPKADIEDGDDGLSPVCRNAVFLGKSLCSQFPKCSECWNQPYFETEEEGGEE